MSRQVWITDGIIILRLGLSGMLVMTLLLRMNGGDIGCRITMRRICGAGLLPMTDKVLEVLYSTHIQCEGW